MPTINLTKTKRSNAVVASFTFGEGEKYILAEDPTSNDYQYCSDAISAMFFFTRRGYKFAITESGEYVDAFNYVSGIMSEQAS